MILHVSPTVAIVRATARGFFAGVVCAMLLQATNAWAQKKYDTGATDTEIKIGNTEAYSGPASSYGLIGKTEDAYFRMINDNGGIHGRKITFVSYDDAFSPPKTVEQTRKLIESDEVLFIFNPLGTLTQSAVHKYLNARKIPQLFIASGSSKWDDSANFPWAMGFQPSYRSVARVFAKYIIANKPDAKIAVFYANDDMGKDYLLGLKDVFGARSAQLIIGEESYENSEPTIDSHIVKLKNLGANVLVNISTSKFAAQVIRKTGEMNWKPMHVLADTSTSIGSVMRPAGLEASEGIVSANYRKDATDPQWTDDPGMRKFMAFIGKYMPGADVSDSALVFGYNAAQAMVHVLERCGDDLTRINIMKQATSIDGLNLDLLLPGIRVKTSAADFAPIEQLQMARFTNGKWQLFGEIISAETDR